MGIDNRWTRAEDDALVEIYVTTCREHGVRYGSELVARELVACGASSFLRTPGAVSRRATDLGLRVTRPPARTNAERRERLLALIRELRGLPVTYRDFEDELNIRSKEAKRLLEPLLEDGHVERFEGHGGQAFYRDPVAWREGSAA
jgi:hypothetical protein